MSSGATACSLVCSPDCETYGRPLWVRLRLPVIAQTVWTSVIAALIWCRFTVWNIINFSSVLLTHCGSSTWANSHLLWKNNEIYNCVPMWKWKSGQQHHMWQKWNNSNWILNTSHNIPLQMTEIDLPVFHINNMWLLCELHIQGKFLRIRVSCDVTKGTGTSSRLLSKTPVRWPPCFCPHTF